MTHYLEVATVYGREVVTVVDAARGVKVCRCDNRTEAQAIMTALSAQVAK